jgi:hypothetical protein
MESDLVRIVAGSFVFAAVLGFVSYFIGRRAGEGAPLSPRFRSRTIGAVCFLGVFLVLASVLPLWTAVLLAIPQGFIGGWMATVVPPPVTR